MDQIPSAQEPKGLDKNTLVAVLQFLNKNSLQGAEDALRKETGFFESVGGGTSGGPGPGDVSNVLSVYKSEGDPEAYTSNYVNLKLFVEKALDIYKYELGQLLFPVFVHMYLELVYNNHPAEAASFMTAFGGEQEDFFQADVQRLSHVTRREHMQENELIQHFRSNQYTVRMCRDSYVMLKRHLTEKQHSLLTGLVQDHLLMDVFEGVPRGRQLIQHTAGALEGDPGRQVNKSKMLYGLLKEPDIQLTVPAEEDDEAEGDDKPKKKKAKKDALVSKKSKNDPNAPSNNRIPLPDLRDIDKREKGKGLREGTRRVNLGPDNLPSICFYTFLNAADNVSCVTLCEDSSMMAVGFSSSTVRVWSLIPQKLRAMKSADDLADIDKDADDVLVRMMDDRSAEQSRTLAGHSGPVHGVSFSPDRTLLLTCSEDGTIRLWSLQTWTCLVCYKGHIFPVWDVRFSPHGHYFCSGGHDRTVRLWATDHHQPLRVMAGHYADVDCVEFHPNSNYVASGSSDRSVRVWDVSNGSCVRVLTGHKDTVYALAFSPDGRFLVSSGADSAVLCWDLASGQLLSALAQHTDTVYSLQFSRDGAVLASGGMDDCIKLWDFQKTTEDVLSEDLNVAQAGEVKTSSDLLLTSFATKHTPVLVLHFTRRNLLLAAGPYQS
ncbi:transcription initiation factor TFIID subunit 5-like [Pollicipes pollicipes]|uniref:LOW QUALITY PROTEIN: transcription initiation factor TFIID subunit 5-like n=1 Tax=Pollicipes pollicipes TaxID=41117 RepID=UPI001885A09C|nr:LOW QUALITY PROTEIN: transcription initiation factor TFIID subunit 5-like [Pollicipes pollicipes]XP_037085716.1 transcription initiation factor TFIID subunit 5-like [Pollicipes pollicipes]XP_037085718.1 transcription initiation factor TFIID subunit 5-like [Pollicipes pollicipes]XP_037085719.1 transcription initiation factor TFIID subunit 5-like [Pollicipes pollicipes]